MARGEDDGTLAPVLYRAVTGRSPRSERTTIPGMVTALQRTYGTTPPPGLKEHTWRRLRGNPRRRTAPATQQAVQAAFRRLRLPESRETRLRGQGVSIVLVSGVRISETDDRDRTIHVDLWPDTTDPNEPQVSDMIGAILDKYHAGDIEGMADAFTAPMAASIGTNVYLHDVSSVSFG